jgi:hypothetical protein
MAESAGRYCPLCGEAVGLVDRSCRWCGENLQVPVSGEGRIPTEDADVPPARRERSRLRHGFSVRFGGAGIIIAIMVLSAACAIIWVAVGD